MFEFLGGWYNLRRRHSPLGYFQPVEFERRRAVVEVDIEEAAAVPPVPIEVTQVTISSA
jgi:hypothetical protein